VSEHAVTAPHPAESATSGAVSSPDFDGQEKKMFGQDDAHAVTVIGKMLVGFFFYSLIIMSAVAFWTMGRGGQVSDEPAHNSHAAEADE
jgi:hypothetical protein